MTDPATKQEWLDGLREYPRPIIFPLIAWLAAIGFVIVLAVLVAGCATEPKEASKSPRSEVCLLQLLGQTDSGVPVVRTTCVSTEEFAESQK